MDFFSFLLILVDPDAKRAQKDIAHSAVPRRIISEKLPELSAESTDKILTKVFAKSGLRRIIRIIKNWYNNKMSATLIADIKMHQKSGNTT